jgi:hypothetical protein
MYNPVRRGKGVVKVRYKSDADVTQFDIEMVKMWFWR